MSGILFGLGNRQMAALSEVVPEAHPEIAHNVPLAIQNVHPMTHMIDLVRQRLRGTPVGREVQSLSHFLPEEFQHLVFHPQVGVVEEESHIRQQIFEPTEKGVDFLTLNTLGW